MAIRAPTLRSVTNILKCGLDSQASLFTPAVNPVVEHQNVRGLDDFAISPMGAPERRDLLELLDDRTKQNDAVHLDKPARRGDPINQAVGRQADEKGHQQQVLLPKQEPAGCCSSVAAGQRSRRLRVAGCLEQTRQDVTWSYSCIGCAPTGMWLSHGQTFSVQSAQRRKLAPGVRGCCAGVAQDLGRAGKPTQRRVD